MIGTYHGVLLTRNMTMKKSLAALAVLGALSSSAHGQSAVTVYGLVDAGIVRESGGVAGSVTSISSGIGSS